jgi:hypothetical protein
LDFAVKLGILRADATGHKSPTDEKEQWHWLGAAAARIVDA